MKKKKKRKDQVFQIRITQDQKERLKEIARKHNLTMAKYVLFKTIGEESKVNGK